MAMLLLTEIRMRCRRRLAHIHCGSCNESVLAIAADFEMLWDAARAFRLHVLSQPVNPEISCRLITNSHKIFEPFREDR